MARIASCHCGQLSLSVEGEPALVSACNCTRCQRRSGSAFALTSRWSKNQITGRSGESVTYARKGASGGKVECVFCPQCGSTVSTVPELLPDLIGIPVGCFADPTFPEPKVAAWCDSKLEWVRFPQEVLLLRDQSRPLEAE
ncbi:GFA family protein [Bradyrhizobium cosmicum]|uniref:GFA family protein n=1 Tax=Bradyrhizobium cosmicum TaxID=1404864 RepID=UPI0011642009|nr:GFA family protein [Bradyrhizobium cosmicum]